MAAAFATPFLLQSHPSPPNRRPRPPICSVKAPPEVSVTPTPSSHKDGPFALAAIAVFRRALQPAVGWRSPRRGYSGFVEECRMLMARVGPVEQRATVRRTLDMLFQAPHGPEVFRKYFADKPGLSSRITPLVFEWLVGACENNRPPEGGWGVHIEKCRFLEEAGCKGLCVNMCQQPTQSYFTDVLGLPVRMTPDYDDMSCQMTFGLPPLPLDEDPAVTGDCLADCKMSSSIKQRGDETCYVNGRM